MANIDSLIQNLGTDSEIEADGHRVKHRSIKELMELKEIQDALDLNEDSKIKQAGYRTKAFNNGTGLI